MTLLYYTSCTGIESHVDTSSHRGVRSMMDSISWNITTIDASWFNSFVNVPKINSLIFTSLIDSTRISTRDWQSISIREVPVPTMETLSYTTTCGQVSVTLNTVTTTAIKPHLTDVHPGMVSQSLSHEGEIRDSVLGEGQRPEERENQQW